MKKTSVKMEWDNQDNEIPKEVQRMFRELRLQIQVLNAQVQHLEGMADQRTRMQDGHNNTINEKIIDINWQLSGEASSSLMAAVDNRAGIMAKEEVAVQFGKVVD